MTGDDDNDDDMNASDDEKITNRLSPVAHLWTSKDDCRPLVRPEDAISTGMLDEQFPWDCSIGHLENLLFWTIFHLP